MEQVVKQINGGIRQYFSKYAGAKVYGMAQLLTRKAGTVSETLPSIVNGDGEGSWVGIDDTAPLISYHRSVSPMQILPRPLAGYGDQVEAVNVYNNVLIVYFDRSRLGLSIDEVQRLMQVAIPGNFKIPNYKAVRTILQNVNLNSQQVYQAEYQNGKIIDPKAIMFQISYQIESRFLKSCFAVCP